jgi:hypothetical protein
MAWTTRRLHAELSPAQNAVIGACPAIRHRPAYTRVLRLKLLEAVRACAFRRARDCEKLP